MEKRKTGEFTAFDDVGNQYQIVEYTEYFDVSGPEAGDRLVPGLTSLMTSDGRAVHKVRPYLRTYEIEGSPPIRLHSNDQRAP